MDIESRTFRMGALYPNPPAVLAKVPRNATVTYCGALGWMVVEPPRMRWFKRISEKRYWITGKDSSINEDALPQTDDQRAFEPKKRLKQKAALFEKPSEKYKRYCRDI